MHEHKKLSTFSSTILYFLQGYFIANEGTACSIIMKNDQFNIRRLAANFDAFHKMLSDMNHSFTIIGLSETKKLGGS